MNKYKVLGSALMASILLEILVTFHYGMTSIQSASSSVWGFFALLSLLCVTLFGSFAALTVDKIK